ncbi:hypothetical protein ARMGADRAFT_1056323 [Armillaria gallica]|uniref:Reverse transcriptase domain-containing protein n=1 Tax=Armillaria gallica TaxID=47427 RepID=A0A2H3CLW7_ARMGA|nr:hypothetical protein ARMGADRAFT_1056323 [Armillaria gallica]
MPTHKDDVVLAGRKLSILAQADDILLLSHLPPGFQLKLDAMASWGGVNFILVNRIKTVAMVYGAPVPSPLPSFAVGSNILGVSEKEKYVGVVFSTDTRSMFENHYKAKEKAARYYGHSIWAIEDHATKSLIEPLVDVQVKFIRKMLHVSSRSMLVPLHTDTGITPLQTRRFILVLKFLEYTLALQDKHLVRAAITNSIVLHIAGRKTWFTDLLQAARNLPYPLAYELDPWSLTPDYVDLYSKMQQVDSSDKLYLLHGRKEPVKNKSPRTITLTLRHYLDVKVKDHRKALTWMLLSSHMLTIERLRWRELGRPRLERDHRKCRFCKIAVESPEHAMLGCTSSQVLVHTRSQMLARLDDVGFLKKLVQSRKAIATVAKWAHSILKIFYAVPVYRGG